MSSFIVALNAVVPFLIYMSYGYIMRTVGVTDDAFLKKLNTVNFKAFFPFIMFYNMYSIDPDLEMKPSFVLCGASLVLILLAILVLTVPRFIKDRPKIGVFIQAVFRSNAMLYSLPLTVNVFGESAGPIAAMMLAVIIPIYNVCAVIVLEHYGGKSSSPLHLLKSIVTNPILIGVAVGFVFYLLRIPVPASVLKPISAFNSLATPLALFALGGTLHFNAIGKNTRYLVAGLSLKMVILPAIVLVLLSFTSFSAVERFVIFAIFATPAAASSYPMAQNMGGDGELAGQFVVLGTVLSVITLFLWISLMGFLGLL